MPQKSAEGSVRDNSGLKGFAFSAQAVSLGGSVGYCLA